MLPGERGLLQDTGSVILQDFSLLTFNILLQGFLGPLSFISIRELVRRRPRFVLTWITSGIIVAGFVSSTLTIAVQWDMCSILIRSQLGLIEDTPRFMEDRQKITNGKLLKWDTAILWLQLIPPLVNDALIVWRGYIISMRGDHWAFYSSLLLWIATFASTITLLGEMSAAKTINSHAELLNDLFISVSVLSIATNLLATMSIAYMLWSHQKFLRQSRVSHKMLFRWTRVSWILFLLFDSGLIYCIFQVGVTVSQSPI
ncbi:hypothetical protein H2248_008194 [Termitomyces sp. 'cryptogamus']|nr:hypothetical protein H2248_008194 [Termitomyces sp. 'cryptogamus']